MTLEAETQPSPERNEDSFTQRGPLRPEQLVSIRRHQDRRLADILGVFDDRADRSPLEMLGVPVLGTTDTMLTHRIMPCVNLTRTVTESSQVLRVGLPLTDPVVRCINLKKSASEWHLILPASSVNRLCLI